MAIDDDRSFLASTTAHPDRVGDTANMNPDMVTRLAAAIRQARSEGIMAGVGSGYRGDDVTGSAFDKAGYSAHGYGLASDISGIGVRGSDTWKRWNQIAQSNGLNNPYLGTASEGPEFNHWQLPPQPLNRMDPSLLANLKAARATGDWSKVWSAYSTPALGTTINASNAPVAGALAHPGTPTPGSSIGDYYHTQMMHESGGKNIPNSVGGWNAAGGYYQFTPATYSTVRAAHPDLNLPESIQDANQDQQTAAMKALTQTNVEALQKAGIAINDKNVALAHFLGPGGAISFIQQMNANPGATAADLFPKEAKSNPTVFNGKDGARTLAQVFDLQTANHGTGNTTGFGPDAQPTDTASAAAPASAAPATDDRPWYAKAFGSLMQGKDGKKSPFEQFSDAMVGSGPKDQKAAMDAQAPEKSALASSGPGARNVSPGLQNVAQTYGQTLNSFSQPLTWNSAPPQAPNLPAAGLQPTPGMSVPGISLNSVQPSSLGVGYGINPVGYGFS